jgi:predicted amidohydrolase
MRIFLSRWVCLDPASNLERLEAECASAVEAGARLVVFPESFLHGYRRTVEPAAARAVMRDISGRFPGAAFVFGSFSEDRFNRMTVWRNGEEGARYDKVHLFAPNGEMDIWRPGDRYVSIDFDGMRFGLLNCNDLRFPEQARALRMDARCDAFLVAAWWPWRRDHVWRTLLRARAIENGVWVAGCCVAASEYPGERFAGAGNYVFDPHGDPVRTSDDRTYDLDPARAANLIVDPLECSLKVTGIDSFQI